MAKKALTAEEKTARENAAKIKKQERIAGMTQEEKALFEQREAADAKLKALAKAKSGARKVERADESKAVWVVFRGILGYLKQGNEGAVKMLTAIMNATPDADAKAAIGRILDRGAKK